MKKFFYYTCLSLLFLQSFVSALVVTTADLDKFDQALEELDEQALVVFDVDYTLIVPKDKILGLYGRPFLKRWIQEQIIRLNPKKLEELRSEVLLQSEVELVDPQVLYLLEKIKQKNIKSIALTAMQTGSYGKIANMEDWRIQKLKGLGIDFSHSFPDTPFIVLDEFKGGQTTPVFKKGVICTTDYYKGPVLVSVLDRLGFKPTKILFIDDLPDYIQSVEDELNKEKIEHICFHYTAIQDRYYQLDQETAKFQLNYLLKTGKWLSDEEALQKKKGDESFYQKKSKIHFGIK